MLQVIGFFAVCFAMSAGAAYSWAILRERRRHPLVVPDPRVSVRISSFCGVYRSRFLGQEGNEWAFDAPLHKNCYVPIDQGAPITIEAPGQDGMLRYRTTVKKRDSESHRILVERPKTAELVERRAHSRSTALKDQIADVGGRPAAVVNHSPWGLLAISNGDFTVGDAVHLKMPQSNKLIHGWILACPPSASGRRGEVELRIVFAEPV